MDSIPKTKRTINPRQGANLFSIFFFTFALEPFRKGIRDDLNENDIYEVLDDYRSEKLGKRLSELWNDELKKNSKSLLRPLFKMFGKEYLAYSLVHLILETSMIYIKPKLLGKVVSYYVPDSTMTQTEAICYSLTLVFCIYIFSFWDHTFLMAMHQLFLRIRLSCTSLVYRKCLKLDLGETQQFASGTALTIITKDLDSFDSALDFLNSIVCGLIQLMIMFVVTYKEMGVSAVFGMLFLLSLYPLYGILAFGITKIRIKTLRFTDKRIRLTQEVLTAIRIIKMYTWERYFRKLVDAVRVKEVIALRNLHFLRSICFMIGNLSSQVALFICVITFTNMGNYMTAEKAFVVIGSFGSVRDIMSFKLPFGVTILAVVKATVDRIINFLLLNEVKPKENVTVLEGQPPGVFMKNVSVGVENKVLNDVNLEFKSGLSVIGGGVGAGKSTILKVILGDVAISEGTVEISGILSYSSQEPWIFPGTIRQNILFGETFDKERYDRVVRVCALKIDFEALDKGDMTCVTDKGLNLSRGQKLRLNLARAIYKQADIYLLDDCLSAVDTHVARHIFEQTIRSFLGNKVCILVMQPNHMLKNDDFIVTLSRGNVAYQGKYENVENKIQSNELGNDESIVKTDKNLEGTVDKPNGINVQAENTVNIYNEFQERGAVKLRMYLNYFKAAGGYIVSILLLLLFIGSQVLTSWSDYFVSHWVDIQQEMSGIIMNHTIDSEPYVMVKHKHDDLMKWYSIVLTVGTVTALIRSLACCVYFSNASINIHRQILHRILNAKILFFDRNMSGNIINRFSRDFSIIDESLPISIFIVCRLTLYLLGILFVVSSVNLFFLIPSLIFFTVLVIARYFYMPTGRSIRRLEGVARSPLIGHLNATLEGLTTVRAFRNEAILQKEFDQHQDLYTSTYYMNISTTEGFAFYLDVLASIYITCISLSFLFLKSDSQAGKVGLAISQSFNLNRFLQMVITRWAELENQMTSTERVFEYANIEEEVKSGKKPDNWPKTGKIVYDKVSLSYEENGQTVLNNLSFAIEPYQKIGIVGRTGAGKSSIISTLFRMYDYKGTIMVDNSDISTFRVDSMRSKFSIIPQDPVLFSETVRKNLDPCSKYTDAKLWDALESVEMNKMVKGLCDEVKEGGLNYSVGQRQLLCMARAILQKNTVLVLDEATANVDPETDALINRTIRRKFAGVTVIMIAHRLHTVMDFDKVMVLNLGNIVEYDNPQVLLKNQDGVFYGMVKEAGLLKRA